MAVTLDTQHCGVVGGFQDSGAPLAPQLLSVMAGSFAGTFQGGGGSLALGAESCKTSALAVEREASTKARRKAATARAWP